MIPPKKLAALVGAWAFGFWTGINYTGTIADPKTVMGDAPEWVSTAESMALYAVVLMAVCAVSWIFLDYRDSAR